MLCILSSASLSRTWAVFDLNGVDTKLPLDCTDDEILDEAAAMAGLEKRKMRFEETPMTSLIVKMKLAVLARKMVRIVPPSCSCSSRSFLSSSSTDA